MKMKYKIYTKLGDKGKTSIIGENKIDKHAEFINKLLKNL